MHLCPPAHDSPTSSIVDVRGSGVCYQGCGSTMNEWIAMQMLEASAGCYSLATR